MLFFFFPSVRVWLAAGPAGSGGGRLLLASLPRRQLPLPGRWCRPLPQSDLLRLSGLVMDTQKYSMQHECDSWQSLTCVYIYLRIILSALFLFWQEKKASGSLNGTKITRGWKTLVKLWICGQTNKWPKGKITERQYCARVLTHPTFLYISLAKWEIGNAICWNVQRYKAETVFADF